MDDIYPNEFEEEEEKEEEKEKEEEEREEKDEINDNSETPDEPAPLPMKSIEEFGKNYQKGKIILNADDFILFSGEEIESKNEIIIKEYKEEFVSKLKDYINLFNFETSCFENFNKNNFKHICRLLNNYKTDNKIILVFEKFDTTLKNELIKKKKLNMNEIACLLIKINEMIKYFSIRQIQDIIFTPETLGINKKNGSDYYSLSVFHLFPYHKLKQKKIPNLTNKSFVYLSPDFPVSDISGKVNSSYTKSFNDKIPKIISNDKYLKAILWNLGALIHELYFGELNFESHDNIYLIKLKNSENNEFNDLIAKTLVLNKDKRIEWKDYLKHKFFLYLKPEEILKIIYDKNIKKNDNEINLYQSQVDDYLFDILLKIKFENLMIINLADNNIQNLEISNENFDSLKITKFFNLEKNKLNDISSSFLKAIFNCEYLFLSYNQINSLNNFKNVNLNNICHLSLIGNKIDDLYPLCKSKLNNLNVLNLSYNNIRNISPLSEANFPFLEELILDNNKINNIQIFEKTYFPELISLNLKSNNITDIRVFSIVKFQKLETLNLTNNKIENINPLKKVEFSDTLKELYLSDNPIREFQNLHLTYFPSLIKVNMLTSSNDNKINNDLNKKLKLLSIKLKLFGYEFNNNDMNNSISIIITPYNLINNSLISDIQSFDYTNSFKIITSSNSNEDKIINFFYENILEMSGAEIKEKENFILIEEFEFLTETDTGDGNRFNNNSVLSYLDDENIISSKNKINSLYMIKKIKNEHEKNKYYKVPFYMNSKTTFPLLNKICPFNIKIENISYYKNKVDNKESFSSFLKKNNYYHNFPIIFINSEYYNGFLKLLNQSPKYKKFKDKNIFKKLLIPSKVKYKYNHFNSNLIIADVVENVDFYSLNDVIEIIDNIKLDIKGNYKELINDWIINIFEIISESFLFILNIKLCYDICPRCKSPLLYIYESNKNNIIINKKEENFDPTLYKSIQFCNNFLSLISQQFDSIILEDYKKKYFGEKPKIYIPANPPKKDDKKTINVIYHDENYPQYSKSINKDAIKFRKYTNGTFIFSNSEESFNLIIKGLKNEIKNEDNIKFLLISTGSTFEKIYHIIQNEHCLYLINKCCIFCMHKENHINKLNKYPNFIQAVYTLQSEVVKFILDNSTEDNKVFKFLKLVTYKDYISHYYQFHELISKYYQDDDNDCNHSSYETAIKLTNELIGKGTIKSVTAVKKGLEIFKTNDSETIIREYTKENSFYRDMNNWLLNLDNNAYEKIAYFVGKLMYKLNNSGEENAYKNNNHITLYRGMRNLNYLDVLSYQIHQGKKICFQTFVSTSEKQIVSQNFSKNSSLINNNQINLIFSMRIEIDHYWKEGWKPLCFDIENYSAHPGEAEFLFHPFSFFIIKEFNVDFGNNIATLKLESINKNKILEEELKAENFHKKIHYNKNEKILELKEKINNENESGSESEN